MPRLRAAVALSFVCAVTLAVGAVRADESPSVNPCALAPAYPAGFAADTNRPGVIDLYFFLAGGAPVRFYECVGGRAHLLGVRSVVANGVETPYYGAAQWRCDRLVRNFAATATLPDGEFVRGVTSVRTLSCRHRFALSAPRRARLKARTPLRIVDRWGVGGIRTRLCVTAPRGKRRCQIVAFPVAVGTLTRWFRASERGQWLVDLQVRSFRVRASVAVGVGPLRNSTPRVPTVLATGDSTIDGVDSFLADDLGNRDSVVADEHPGFAISNGDWDSVARAQVARLHPAATVISIGANEGFPMTIADGTTHACCDAAWNTEYARRVRQIMLTYLQNGRGKLIYLTIVAPREMARVPITTAVNKAILVAARGLRGVQVLRMDLLFSPHGYQQYIRYRGRAVAVREPDGIHLNVAGTAIEAAQVARALSKLS